MRSSPAVLFGLIASWSLSGQTYTISTFAGGALPAGTPGTSANLHISQGVGVDPSGNALFASQNAILRLDATTGVLAVVAGNGTAGFSGDNGPATNAQLDNPNGIAFDAAGNIYIADTNNNRIRKVANGTITTVAGNGSNGFSGDNGPAIDAQLDGPYGVAVDSAGNLYVADTWNSRIRKVTRGVIGTVAGSAAFGFGGDNGLATAASLYWPYGVAVDSTGNVYIADTWNDRVRRVTNGVITTVAGSASFVFGGDGGPAAKAGLQQPYGVAVDASGNLYIADTWHERIRKVANGVIATVAGDGNEDSSGDNGPATSAGLFFPEGVAVDSVGNIFIADIYVYDPYSSRIRKVTNGVIATVAGGGSSIGDNGPATHGQLSNPSAIAVDSTGNIYVADQNNSIVRKVTNGAIATVAGNGRQAFTATDGLATGVSLSSPAGVAVDSAGSVYITDSGTDTVRQVTNGAIATVAGGGGQGSSGDNGPAIDALLASPGGIAVDSAGNLYIADTWNNRIRQVTNGVITTVAGNGTSGYSGDNGPAIDAELSLPFAVAVDSAGALYIADSNFCVIRKVANGTIATVAGNASCSFSGDNGPATGAQLSDPMGVAVDGAGNLYIADEGNSRIRKVTNGVIATIAGGGTQFGENGPATSSELANPAGVAVDSAGKVYVADSANNRVRLLTPPPTSLSISQTRTGSFTPGQQGATYIVTVENAANAGPTAGLVTVTETPPSSLTLVSMAGAGWTCPSGTNTCSRSDPLYGGASYPPITVTVNVANAASAPQMNSVSVTGGGSVPASATDSIVIDPCSIILTSTTASAPAPVRPLQRHAPTPASPPADSIRRCH